MYNFFSDFLWTLLVHAHHMYIFRCRRRPKICMGHGNRKLNDVVHLFHHVQIHMYLEANSPGWSRCWWDVSAIITDLIIYQLLSIIVMPLQLKRKGMYNLKSSVFLSKRDIAKTLYTIIRCFLKKIATPIERVM
jgi:hypothetical protein